MERIILKHLAGSKVGQVEEFPLKHFAELSIGREPGSTVQFHPEQDDLVGRRHAKIEPDTRNPGHFLIVDLASRNGTFLNRRRVYEPTRITPGDVLQLGPGGPEFQFQLDPPAAGNTPEPRPKPEQPSRTSQPTPLSHPVLPAPSRRAPAVAPDKAHSAPVLEQGVSAADVERMIAHSSPKQKRSYTGLLALIMSLISVSLLSFLYLGGARPGALPLSGSAIADRNRSVVVSIESSWKLHDATTGSRLYHVAIANPVFGRYEQFPVIAARRVVPVFARYPNGMVQPLLSTDSRDGEAFPFGAGAVGSGFVATPDGFILTARSVAAGWDEHFRSWSSRSVPGLVAVFVEQGNELKWTAWEELLQPPADWVPGRSRFVLPEGADIAAVSLPLAAPPKRAAEGRYDYMEVRFAQASSSFPATLDRVSDLYSVAIIKIAPVDDLAAAEIGSQDEPAKAGDRATVMGFPSSGRGANNESQEPGSILADPTIHIGHVGRVIGSDAGDASELERICPGCYQLDIGVVGSSHSGGPVFNQRGEVIGLYQNLVTRDVSASLGVPIRVGRELMEIRASN
jgi:hypothetical protein